VLIQAFTYYAVYLSEVFAIVSLTLFLPICLEQFARDNGFFAPERNQACTTAPKDERRCVVKLGWFWVDTASFRSEQSA
jgi:UMF1 family MFS transporter